MRLLITGASGFIGHNVLLRAPREWELLAVFHRTPGLDAFVARHGLTHVRPLHCDLTDRDDVAALVAATGPVDACLYLAANGDPAQSAARPAWDLALNTLAPVTLLEQLRTRHVVYVSSGAVYDGLSGAVSPETPVAPRLPYAISKLATEHYVRAFAERIRSVDSYINVRFFGAYGPYEPDRKITSRWLRGIINGQRDFPVRGNGENLIDFMYVDDAVDGLLALTKAGGFSGTVDFASGTPVTVNHVVATMAAVLGVSATVRHEGHTEEYIQFHSVDQAMRERFGITPSIAFEEGISRLHQHLLREGHAAGQSA
jgi:nucleoside-diphosphate-sugar epimerase